MATQASKDAVQKAFIAYLGRPATLTGLNWWADKYEADGNNLDSLVSLISTSAESLALYDGATTTAFVEQVFNQTLGRSTATAEGLAYWVDQVDNQGMTRAELALSVMNVASAAAADTVDGTTTANKLAAANAFSEALTAADELNYVGATAAASARTWLATVTTDASLTTAEGTMAATIAALAPETPSVPGETYTLTTDADTFFGTEGDDTFTGTDSTYAATDTIADATTTDNDTLTITVETDDTDLNLTGTIVGIENVNVNVQEFTNATFALDAAGVSGGTISVDVTQAGSSINDVDVSNVADGTVVSLSDEFATAGILTVDDDASVTVNTAASAITVQDVSSAGAVDDLTIVGQGDVTLTTTDADGDVTITAAGDVDVTAATAATVTVTATGAATITDADAATTLTVSAAGAIADGNEITTAAALTTLNISGNADSLVFDVADTQATLLETVNISGTQDVTVTLSGADVDAITDFTVADTTTAGTTRVDLATASDAGTIDLADVAVDEIELSADFDSEVVTVASGANLLITADQDNAGGGTTITAAAAGAATNSVTVNITDDDADVDSVRDLDDSIFSNFATVNIVLADDLHIETAADAAANLTATDADIIVTGAGDLSNITAGVITADSIDGSAMTGVATLFLSGATDTVSTGSEADTLTVEGASTAGYDLSTGAEDDTISVGVTVDSYTIDGGAGTDTVEVGDDLDLTGETFALTNVEVLDIQTTDATTLTVDSAELVGKTFVVTDTLNGNVATLDVTVTEATVDLSGLVVNAADVAVTIDANTYTSVVGATVTGTNAIDTITIDGGEDSTANGGAGADDITGGAGDDTINGDAGSDTNLDGAAGVDTIDGGAGDDTIIGGTGADALTGGTGDDNFTIVSGDSGEATMDIIADYQGAAAASDNDTITLDSSDDNTVGETGTTDATVTLTIAGDVAAGAGTHDVSGADAAATATDIDAIITDGMLTLEGADAASIDTLAEYIDAALLVFEVEESATGTDADDITEYAIGVEFGGNTYVITALDSNSSADSVLALDDVVQLTGVTGSTLALVAAADTILIA